MPHSSPTQVNLPLQLVGEDATALTDSRTRGRRLAALSCNRVAETDTQQLFDQLPTPAVVA